MDSSESSVARSARLTRRVAKRSTNAVQRQHTQEQADTVLLCDDATVIVEDVTLDDAFVLESCVDVHLTYCCAATQTDRLSIDTDKMDSEDQPIQPKMNTEEKPVSQPPVFSLFENYQDDRRAINFYTGLANTNLFKTVFHSLGHAAFNLKYVNATPTLSVIDQFFLTLIKLKQYKTNYELSIMFKISESEVYNIFVTWIRFMALQWREINIWPQRDVISFFMPSDFKRKFPSTRVVIDGTECPVQKPTAPLAQQSTFSHYKNRNTAKVLVGVTPCGMVSYVSEAYGGSTSDRQIVERSRLTRLCEPGDSIMADKGFNVQDIFAPLDVSINIPTFFKKKNKMSGASVLRDRKISSKRVHVERVIGLGKTYKILQNSMKHTEVILASDIIFVCFMLVNFRKCIVPTSA